MLRLFQNDFKHNFCNSISCYLFDRHTDYTAVILIYHWGTVPVYWSGSKIVCTNRSFSQQTFWKWQRDNVPACRKFGFWTVLFLLLIVCKYCGLYLANSQLCLLCMCPIIFRCVWRCWWSIPSLYSAKAGHPAVQTGPPSCLSCPVPSCVWVMCACRWPSAAWGTVQ